jgi:hypothetical protein
MAIIQDWKIRSTHAKCEVSGEPFQDGEVFYTCIFEDAGTEGFTRRDYSAEAWKKTRKSLDPQPFSFWKSTYKAPVKAAEENSMEDRSVEGMLRRFIEEDSPVTENARYILALMLERKKTLIPVDSQETDSRTLLFYEHADNGDVFIVADPGLRLDEIEAVQREVVDLLAEEDRKAEAGAESVNETLVEHSDKDAESNEDQTEEKGEKSTESEDEAVALSGDDLAESNRLDPGVDTGEELPDGVDDHLERPESSEEPPASND